MRRKTDLAGIEREIGLHSADRASLQSLPDLFSGCVADDGPGCADGQTHSGWSGVRLDNRTSAGASELLRNFGRCAGRGSRLERIRNFAAPAFPMLQDAVDHARICNKGNDAHPSAATAQQWIHLENFLDQPSPRAARLPGGIRIVGFAKRGARQAGAISI